MNIGVIGYGRRIRSVVNEVLKQDERVKLTAIADIRHLEIKEQLTQEGNDSIRYYDQADTMLDQEALDGVLIGTRCSLHTEMALKVMQRRIPLYLEKPVATSMTDLYRLKEGYEASKAKVVVSFPLRVTTIVQRVKEIIDSGKIGEVAHVQAVNNVPYGLVYFQSWYRDEQETGGLFLQKATHDFDYINSIVGQRPTQVCAMTSKQVFKPTKPAGLKCVDCDENRTCNESVLIKTADSKGGEYCCYAADTGNEDSGSALLRYATGLHASYSQNFFIRGAAKARGARFMGHKGRSSSISILGSSGSICITSPIWKPMSSPLVKVTSVVMPPLREISSSSWEVNRNRSPAWTTDC